MERLMEFVDVEAGDVCCISNLQADMNQVNLQVITLYLRLSYRIGYRICARVSHTDQIFGNLIVIL